MKHSGILFSIIALPFLLLFWGCPENGVTPPSRPMELTLEDVTCTEAVIKISLAAEEGPKKVVLKRDGTVIYSSTMDSSEVIIREKDLLPQKTYTYTLWREVPRKGVEAATSLRVTTLDTTSHIFTWHADTLGGMQTTLNGIWASSGNDIWAVGSFAFPAEFYANVAHYDGKKWKYQFAFVNDTINWLGGGDLLDQRAQQGEYLGCGEWIDDHMAGPCRLRLGFCGVLERARVEEYVARCARTSILYRLCP